MTDEQTYTLIVNGRQCQVSATPQTYLMDVLRDQLRLTGVKDGCGTGHCGSCMVIKDGEAVRACRRLEMQGIVNFVGRHNARIADQRRFASLVSDV